MPVKDLAGSLLSGGSFDRSQYVDEGVYLESSNLVSHFKLDGNANDNKGLNNLTPINSPAYTGGQIGQALQLISASHQYCKIAHASQSGLEMSASFTISCWIRLTTVAAGVICSKNSASRTEQYSLEVDSGGHLVINIYTGSAYSVTSNLILNAGSWYHVVAFFDPSNNLLKLYVNGVFSKQTSTTGATLTSSTNDFAIGAYGSTPGTYFNGLVDEFQIWNTVLTVDEIFNLYLNGLGTGSAGGGYGFGTLAPVSRTLDLSSKTDEDLTDIPQYANLGAYFRFANSSPIDRSRNGYDLAPQNAPTYVTGQPYASGEAANFNGSNQYFLCPLAMSVKNQSKISISVWFYTTNLRNYNTIFSESVNGSATDRFQLNINASGALQFGGRVDGGGWVNFAVTIDNTIQANKWYHVVAIFDTSTAGKLYVNGVDATSASAAGSTFTNSDPSNGPYIGCENTGNPGYWQGYISEFLYWKGLVISSSEVQQLFLRGLSANAYRNNYQATGVAVLTNVYSSGTDVSKIPQSANLKGYWRADEASWSGLTGEVIDSSGNGNNGTAKNGATTSATAKLGRSGLYVAASTQYVTVPGNAGLQPTQYTLNAWINLVSQPGSGIYYNIMSVGNSSYSIQLYYYNNTGTKQLILTHKASGGAFQTVSINQTLANSTWYHLTGTYNGTNLVLYLNGVLIGLTATANPPFYSGSTTVSIGILYDSIRPFDGYIDEAALWNVGLTPVEAASLYLGKANALIAKAGNYLPQPAEVRLYAHLSESNYTSGANDSSQMGNSLTNNNTVATLQRGRIEPNCADFTSASVQYLSRANVNQRGLTLVAQKKMSVLLWMRVKTAISAEILGTMATTAGWQLRFDATNNCLEVRMNGTTGVAYSATNSIIIGRWQLVGFTWDGSSVQCYVDGQASGLVGSYSMVVAATTYDFSIGRSAGSSGGTSFEGQLQTVIVWAINLTASQVSALYGYAFAPQPNIGQTIFLQDLNNMGRKMPCGIARLSVQDLGTYGVASLNKLNIKSDLSSGTNILARTRTGASPSPDETWELFRPINPQRVVDLLQSGTGWASSNAILTLSPSTLSGSGIKLANTDEATGEFVEKSLLSGVDVRGFDYLSVNAYSTRSGVNAQIQLGTGSGIHALQSAPGTFDLYLVSGVDPFGEMLTMNYFDLRNMASGANLDPANINYLAIKILDGNAAQEIHLSELAVGTYLHSGANSINSTPQRYVQIEMILTTTQ